MNNMAFMMNVKTGVGKPEFDISIESWRRWCDKNDVELFVLEELVLPIDEMHLIWQRYYVFDLLEANGIEPNQILLVDADTIVHPNCPNFFDETENKFCLVHDDASYDWILRGMEHYSKYVFDGAWFDFWKYGNAGFQIVNNIHRPFFDYMREFYFTHKVNLEAVRSTFGVGTDQTVLNFNLNLQNIDVKLLPYEFNMSCMLKKEILGDDMMHTKVGWVMHFNGLPNKDKSVPYWMEKTYKHLYG